MRGTLFGIIIGAIGGYVATLHGQLTPVPTPAPGITNVTGAVAVSNQPTVLARQDGSWVVTCTTPQNPSVPPIVQAGDRVRLTYTDGRAENVQVSAVRPDGWIVVGARRINLASVASIQP